MKNIKVTINEDGSVEIVTSGFKGKSCLDATKSLEQALGVVKKDSKTPEYFQQETTTNQQRT